MTDEEMRRRAEAWVRRTTAEQGLPEKVTDLVVLEMVAAILLDARGQT